MKPALLLLAILLVLARAQALAQASLQVEIYILKSYSTKVTEHKQSTYITSITNAILNDSPLVRDKDIIAYDPSTTTFHLRRNLNETFKELKEDEAFAVTVNKKPIYYGFFHPCYLPDLKLGIATIEPSKAGIDKTLVIRYITTFYHLPLKRFDKRNNRTLLKTLKSSNRLCSDIICPYS
jgi:hypothetical protein